MKAHYLPRSPIYTMKLLPKFGKGSMADENGYDLPLITGWLEDMCAHEDDKASAASRVTKARLKRISLVFDAIEKLTEVMNMGDEQ